MGISDTELEELSLMLEAIKPEIKTLTEWQQGFMKDQIDRFEKYGAGIFLSPKQWGKIKEVYTEITGDTTEEHKGGKSLQEEMDDEIPF